MSRLNRAFSNIMTKRRMVILSSLLCRETLLKDSRIRLRVQYPVILPSEIGQSSAPQHLIIHQQKEQRPSNNSNIEAMQAVSSKIFGNSLSKVKRPLRKIIGGRSKIVSLQPQTEPKVNHRGTWKNLPALRKTLPRRGAPTHDPCIETMSSMQVQNNRIDQSMLQGDLPRRHNNRAVCLDKNRDLTVLILLLPRRRNSDNLPALAPLRHENTRTILALTCQQILMTLTLT
jgi:hypothetical protein